MTYVSWHELPEQFLTTLRGMSLEEIAALAARYRSNSCNRKGSTTAGIFSYVRSERIMGDKVAYDAFNRLYAACWRVEKLGRTEGDRQRPETRPIMGPRPRRRSLARCGFVRPGLATR